MKNYLDGGEAILEAFRKLKVDYIMSSPGSEWSPVWEALARQKLNKAAGPTFVESWHENVAVNMATGYTLMTGRPQAVLLHAAVGMLQGSMGVHGALQNEVPMVVMSGESKSLGENPDLEIEQQWYGGLTVGGIERFVEPVVEMGAIRSPAPTRSTRAWCAPARWRSAFRSGRSISTCRSNTCCTNGRRREDARDVPAASKLQAPAEESQQVADMLINAKNPVIVAETSGRDPKAFTALVELAEALAIPVINGRVTSYANFPTDHPLYLGFNTYGALKDAEWCCWSAAAHPGTRRIAAPPPAKIVQVHENPHKEHMIYQNLHADFYLEGDVAASLAQLVKVAKAAQARRADRRTAQALDQGARKLCGEPSRPNRTRRAPRPRSNRWRS